MRKFILSMSSLLIVTSCGDGALRQETCTTLCHRSEECGASSDYEKECVDNCTASEVLSLEFLGQYAACREKKSCEELPASFTSCALDALEDTALTIRGAAYCDTEATSKVSCGSVANYDDAYGRCLKSVSMYADSFADELGACYTAPDACDGNETSLCFDTAYKKNDADQFGNQLVVGVALAVTF